MVLQHRTLVGRKFRRSNGSATLTGNLEEAFERSFYATNNSSHLKLHDNSLLLVTTVVDPRNRLYFFPPNLKQEIERLLKLKLKSIDVVRLLNSVTFR